MQCKSGGYFAQVKSCFDANLNLCKIRVPLTTSQKNKCDNMMHIIPRP